MLIGEVAFLANMAVVTVVMCLSVYCKSGLPLNMYKYIQIFHFYFKLLFSSWWFLSSVFFIKLKIYLFMVLVYKLCKTNFPRLHDVTDPDV